MSSKENLLDLWIVETNTVYKEVPYVVVTDWLQQGRLLEDDKAKPSGSKDWQRLGDVLQLQAFLPRAEPFRADDQAEALEPVEIDFPKRETGGEDEDVDMIPLIDVSLVLLVFFMLSASASALAVASSVQTPEMSVDNALQVDNSEGLHIDIALDSDDLPIYSLRAGNKPAAEEESDLRSMASVLDRLRTRLLKTTGKVELHINADKRVPAKLTRDLGLGLRAEPFRSRILGPYWGVTGVE